MQLTHLVLAPLLSLTAGGAPGAREAPVSGFLAAPRAQERSDSRLDALRPVFAIQAGETPAESGAQAGGKKRWIKWAVGGAVATAAVVFLATRSGDEKQPTPAAPLPTFPPPPSKP